MRKIICFAAAAGALFLVVSCASAPPAPPPEQPKPQPQATQPEKPAVAAPDAELAKAKGLQQRVDALGLGTFAPEDYAAANKDLQAGQDAYGKDNAASKSSLQAAISEYNAVLSKGGPLFLARSQEQTEASKKAADDLKAFVAVKDDYAKADGTYKQALQEKDAGDIENANRDFGQARDDFDFVAKAAQQKKDAALQALQSAQQDRTASEQKAQDAQKALKDEGFSASGTGQ
jgi:hypothetical protein